MEERNAGLGPRHRDRLTLKRAAEDVGLTMSNSVQILSRHVRRRIAEQILADQTASVNDLKTILYLVHAQHVALTDAVHGFIRDQASIARGSDVYNLPGGINGVAGRNRIVLGLTNAKQRQDEKISAREAKQAKLENEIKDATKFLASIREKLTTKQAVSGLRIADLNKVYLAVFGKRPRQHSLKSELIEQVSSKLFEKDEVGDIVPPSAHSLPRATLTEDDTTAWGQISPNRAFAR